MTRSRKVIQHLADQLPPQEQVPLIEHRSRRVARAIPPVSVAPAVPSSADAWSRFFALSDELRATYPDANPAARLDADRRERDAAVRPPADVRTELGVS